MHNSNIVYYLIVELFSNLYHLKRSPPIIHYFSLSRKPFKKIFIPKLNKNSLFFSFCLLST